MKTNEPKCTKHSIIKHWEALRIASKTNPRWGFCADCTEEFQEKSIDAGVCSNPHLDMSDSDKRDQEFRFKPPHPGEKIALINKLILDGFERIEMADAIEETPGRLDKIIMYGIKHGLIVNRPIWQLRKK